MTPGLLMPVRAIAEPWAYVTGTYADGTVFKQAIWDHIAPVDVAGLSWFHNFENPVVNIGAFEYTSSVPYQDHLTSEWDARRVRYEDDRDPVHARHNADPTRVIEIVRNKHPNFYDTIASDMQAWETMTFAKIDALKRVDVIDSSGKMLHEIIGPSAE